MVVSFGFYGSSDINLALKHDKLVDNILLQIFNNFKSVRIITGGYSGFMETVCKRAKEISQNNSNIYLENYGILYAGFSKYDNQDNPNLEKPNKYLDKTINTKSIGERIDTCIELSDYIFVLPGGNGTLNELLHTQETLKYPPKLNFHINYQSFFVSDFWKGNINNKQVNFFNSESKFLFERNNFQKLNQSNPFKGGLFKRIKKIICFDNGNITDILGLDFAYLFYDKELVVNEGFNKSKSTGEYIEGLDDFLKNNESLLNFEGDISSYSYLNNRSIKASNNIKKSKSILKKKKTSKILQGDEVFEIWNDHLINSNIGKQSFWVNRVFDFKGIKANISCFLVLDLSLSKYKSEKILGEINNYIFSEGVKNLLEKTNNLLVTTNELLSFENRVNANQHTVIGEASVIQKRLKRIKDSFEEEEFDQTLLAREFKYLTSRFNILMYGLYFIFKYENVDNDSKLTSIISYITFFRKHYEDGNFIINVSGNKKLIEYEVFESNYTPKVFLLFWNIINNAYKYSADSKIDILISDNKEYVSISMKNKLGNKDISLKGAKTAIEYLTHEKVEYNFKSFGGLKIIKEILNEVSTISLDKENTLVENNTLLITLNFEKNEL